MNKRKILEVLENDSIDKLPFIAKLVGNEKFKKEEFISYLEELNNNPNVKSNIKADVIYNTALALNDDEETKVKLTELIIKTQDYRAIYNFARDIKNVDLDLLSRVIVSSKDGNEIYLFAKNIKGANIKVLGEGMFLYGSSKEVYEFAKHIEDADIKLLSKGVAKQQNAALIYKFASEQPKADIEPLKRTILKCNKKYEAKYIYLFALNYINNEDIEDFCEKIIRTNDPRYIYGFAMNIEGANIEKLERAIIKTKNLEYIRLFAQNVKGTKLTKQIKKTNK